MWKCWRIFGNTKKKTIFIQRRKKSGFPDQNLKKNENV